MWWVYVLQSLSPRVSRSGATLPGFHYVGCTTNPSRRLREHNGELKGRCGKYTAKHRPWRMRAIFGPYVNRSEAMKAERALKKGKRGPSRCLWSISDSHWCRGLGVLDPRVEDINASYNP